MYNEIISNDIIDNKLDELDYSDNNLEICKLIRDDMSDFPVLPDLSDFQELKKYKSVKPNKAASLFNKKLERTHVKTFKRYNKIQNTFYRNQCFNTTKQHCENNVYLNTKFNNKLSPCGLNDTDFSSFSQDINPNKYCINCGNTGHTKGHCSEPNISNGVVAVRFNMVLKEYEYFIIMRKHSHGYCDLIRGKYTDNVNHIKQLLEETTLDERNYLINYDFKNNWIYLWGDKNNILTKYKNTQNMERKFEMFKTKYLNKLLPEITTAWVEPEWGFPKGQREVYEKNIQTAFREFSEESGYSTEKCVCIANILPLQELFIGSNNKTYKQLYYVAFMNYEDTSGKINFQSNEIGDACWANIETVVLKFRNYDVDKIRIARDINEIMKTSIFVDV